MFKLFPFSPSLCVSELVKSLLLEKFNVIFPSHAKLLLLGLSKLKKCAFRFWVVSNPPKHYYEDYWMNLGCISYNVPITNSNHAKFQATWKLMIEFGLKTFMTTISMSLFIDKKNLLVIMDFWNSKIWTSHLIWTLQNGEIIIDIYFDFVMGTQHDFEDIWIMWNLG